MAILGLGLLLPQHETERGHALLTTPITLSL